MEYSLLDIKYARLAAIIDCEGTIVVVKTKGELSPYYTLRIRVGNTDKRLIDFLNKEFNGWVGKETRTKGCKDLWIWEVRALNAKKLLEKAFPYLIVKKEQAILVIQLQCSVEERVVVYGHTKLDASTIKYRDDIIKRLHELNKKGV